ncbi:cell wall hydrolase [Devosia sp. PTR5]|uniref:Cell wall hydrolase n=1 Tax=Devosia oryzisoli TaxID=2774138 RepID=A0A927FWN2_9HYPH|nr:cell wall hydrolase [Devosia oryzisoli]MBD8066193.1 cell wall hydrolase [Devosia oryzisoli]
MRAVSHALAIGAAALVLFVTLSPARADQDAVFPQAVPADIAQLRTQPALGPTLLPPEPGRQHLNAALLTNYIKRQETLRAFDVNAAGPKPELTADVLMGYIARGSLGGGNMALSAIDSFTSEPAKPASTVTSDLLASYVQKGYVPTAKRIETANNERGCLAQAIYHEARGESATGQLAVANIIVNRARSKRFPASLCGVVYQNADKGRYRCQFTFACDGRSDTPKERRAWARSVALAEKVYAEYATGEDVGALPKSALYYHTTAVRPSWSRTYQQVAEVGAHIFYAPN